MPTHWYNVVADMPNPPAPPMGPDGKAVEPTSCPTLTRRPYAHDFGDAIGLTPLVNTPPAKAGGFGLRLKAGSIGHSAD